MSSFSSASSTILIRLAGRGAVRPVGAVVVAALIAAVGLVAVAPAQVAQAAPPVQAAKVTSAPDLLSARVAARAQGSRIEVESERAATSTTWVNPDGTLTTEQHQGPIRFREKDGSWRDVDLAMAEWPDGSAGPRGHAVGLRLKGASATASGAPASATETDVVSVSEPGKSAREVVLAWPGRVGKPTLDGEKATYPEVQPGVDLVVESRRTGYEQLLVVKSAAALTGLQTAAKDGVVSWSLPVKTKGLTARAEADGSVSFVDPKGTVVSRFVAPTAWDATIDPRSGEHTSTSAVKMSVTQQGKGRAVLTLTPDQGWLADPARAFPLTVDPTYASGSVTSSLDTYVSSQFSTTTYNTATELRVGTYNGGGDKYRSFLNFPVSGIAGKQIVSASLSLYEFHSWSCTAKTFNVYTSGAAGSGTTWANQPAPGTSSGALTVAKGFSSTCAAGRVSVPITAAVQGWSTSGWVNGSLRLSASETDNYGWKKFYSLESTQDPYITFTYNRKPNAAAAPTLQAPPAVSYTAPGSSTPMLFTTDSTPLFSSKATDPDASTVSMTTEVHTSTTATSSTLKASCVTALVASGATGSCSPTTALADSMLYYARTAVKDQLGLWNGTWSPWTSFYTSWSTPPVPVISCPAPYSNASWQDLAPTADITCTVTAAGVAGNYATPGYLDLTVDGVVKPRLKITPSNDPNVAKTTVVVAKTLAGGHTIKAVSVARTLKVSAASTYSFGWGQSGLSQPGPPPAARVTTTGSIKVAASGPPKGTSTVPTAKVRWRVAGSADNELVGWNDAKVAPLEPVVDGGTAGVTVKGSWDTKSETADAFLDSDPNTAGVQPTALNDRVPVLLDVQVCLTYSTSGTQCTWSATKVSVLRVPHAFGNGFPTADAGPGQVALFTGEFNTSATDVTVPGYTGALSISRSHSTFGNSAAAAVDPVSSVFGPGWTAQLDGSDAGNAGLQVADGTGVDGTIAFIDADGSALVYSTATGARRTVAALTTGTYPGVDEATKTSATTLTVSLVAGITTLTLTDEDGTKTAFTAITEPATKTTAVKFAPATVTEPGSVGATSYTRDASGRVTRILAPVPPGVTCPATGTLNPGCRALRVIYATVTSTTFPGDTAGQVSGIWLDIYDPAKAGGPGMISIQVAAYKYDASKRLVHVRDPRSTVAPITYGYDAGNHLTQVASAGQTPIALTYTGTDPKLSSVTRARPAGDPAGGTATLAAFVYDVATSGAGLPDLSGTAVATWAQAKAPTYAAAAFGPDYTGSLTTPDYTYADLSYTDEQGYTINTASYGAGAWQRTAAEYDTHGNLVQTLDAAALAAVVAGGNPGAADQVSSTTVYNPADILGAGGVVLTPAGTLVSDTYGPARKVTLADGSSVIARPRTQTGYDLGAPNAGVNPITGVAYRLPTTVTTSAADPGGGPDLAVVSKTLTGYAPIDGKPAGDPTSGWVLGAATTSTTDMDLSGTLTTGDITTRTRFDDQGRAVESRQPSSGAGTSTPADAGTTLTAFYTTATQSAPNAACGGKPQWAGLTCRTYPAADPSAGASGAGTLPDSTTESFSYLLAPLSVVETSGSVTRTTTSTYLADGRPDTTRTTVAGLASSIPQAGTQVVYDASTGQALRQMKLDPTTGAVTTTGTTSMFDAWGRVTSFTSDAGDVATTAYDAAGRVATVTDAKGAVAYTYDGPDAAGLTERRGKTTKVAVTRTGTNTTTGPLLTYTGAYDEAGALTLQKLPGGINQTTTYDVGGQPVGLAYAGQVTPVTETTDPVTGEITTTPGTPFTGDWLTWSQDNDINGRVAREWTPAGAAFAGGPGVNALGEVQPYDTGDALGSDRAYTYDRADRLVKVADRTASVTGTVFDPADPTAGAGTGCTVRTYDYAGTIGSNGNRTSQTSNTFGPDCAATPGTPTSRAYVYDTADRPTTGAGGSGQYVYDALGRQSTLPAADAPTPGDGTSAHDITLAYYDSDLPQAITQDGVTTAYTLNTDGRRQVATTGPTGGAPTSTTVRHYTDTSDNPVWTDTTTTGIGGGTSTARHTENLAGDLGATISVDGAATLAVNNSHGDTVTTITIPAAQTETVNATSIGPWSDYTEFGTSRDTAATTAVGGAAGYGWLGAKQRSTTAESAGLTLMGDRLYNATTGRFTSLDPEPGGNLTAYTYPLDPINALDLDGHSYKDNRLGGIGGASRGGSAAMGGSRSLRSGPGGSYSGSNRASRSAGKGRGGYWATYRAERKYLENARSCARNSFTSETMIIMADRTQQPISEVEVGDRVLATDPITGITSSRVVTELIIGYGMKNLIELTIDTNEDGKGQVITATDLHPIWSTNRRAWVNAVDLKVSDKLLASNGLTGRILQRKLSVRVATVYNFTVAQTHTYYVVTDTSSTLVHNNWCGAYSDHGRDQARRWGISDDMIRQTVKTGRRGKGNSKNEVRYKGRKVWVVLDRRRNCVVSCGWN